MRAIVILALLAGVARAESPLEEEAKRHYFAGKKQFDAGKFADALAEYGKSYELTHYPALEYNLALCYEQLQQYPEALQAFEAFLTAEPSTPRRANVEARMQVLRTVIAASKPAPPPPEPFVEAKPIEKPAPVVVAPVVVAPAVVAPIAKPARTPVYRRWWVWTLTGVAVAGVALGVGLGVGLAAPSFDTNLGSFGRGAR